MTKPGRKKISNTGIKRQGLLSSVRRTLSLIDLLSIKNSIGVSEASRILRTAKSTAYRMLATLEYEGYAAQCPETGNYSLGQKFFEIASKTLKKTGLNIDAINSSLRKLTKNTRENAIFAIIDSSMEKMIVLTENLSSQPVIAHPMLSNTIPLLESALGISYLSQFYYKELNNKLDNLLKNIKKNQSKIRKDLIKKIEESRTNGYSYSTMTKYPEISMIAAPVISESGLYKGSIGLIFPKFRAKNYNIEKFGKLITLTSKKISANL